MWGEVLFWESFSVNEHDFHNDFQTSVTDGNAFFHVPKYSNKSNKKAFPNLR